MCQPQTRSKSLLLCLVHSASSPALSMAPLTKVLLFYLASSLFLCSFTTMGQATNELFEEDPTVALRSHNGEQIRNELAMLVNENINWDKINKMFGERLMHLFSSALNEKNKRDDDVPPGFIGVRGRRSRREFEDIIRTSEYLRNLLNGHHNLLVPSLETQNPMKQGQLKKSDSNAYKDGFLGVRG